MNRTISMLTMDGPVTRHKHTALEDGWLGLNPGSMGYLRLEQGSLEWAMERAKYITASEVAGLCGEAKFGPNTMQKVLDQKRGKASQADNPAMAHGRAMEPLAREMIEQELGIKLPPAVMVRGRILASLDGWDEATRTLVEIKCPFRATQVSDDVPDHYLAQLAVQAWVCCPQRVFFAQYIDGAMTLTTVDRAYLLERFMRLYTRPICDAYRHLLDGTDPDPERDDDEWAQAARAFVLAHANVEGAERRLSDAREALLALSGDQAARGAGVRVTWQERAGSVNWKAEPIRKALDDAGIDLEAFKGKASRYSKVEVLK